MAGRLRPALEAAYRDHEVAQAAWRAHRTGCHACHQAAIQGRPRLACDDGFRLWQARDKAARAMAARRDADATAAAAQLLLGA